MNGPVQRRDTPLSDLARTRILTIVALITGAAYLIWRAGTLGSGALLALSIPAYAVEVWAFAQLALFGLQAWRVPTPTLRINAATRHDGARRHCRSSPSGAGTDDLERTLLGTRALHGCGRVVVIDDVDRPAIRGADPTVRLHAHRRRGCRSLAAHGRTRPYGITALCLAGRRPGPHAGLRRGHERNLRRPRSRCVSSRNRPPERSIARTPSA